jgi:hypothetical protein
MSAWPRSERDGHPSRRLDPVDLDGKINVNSPMFNALADVGDEEGFASQGN